MTRVVVLYCILNIITSMVLYCMLVVGSGINNLT